MKDFKFKLMLRKVVLLVNCVVYLGFNRSSLSAVQKRPERTMAEQTDFQVVKKLRRHKTKCDGFLYIL